MRLLILYAAAPSVALGLEPGDVVEADELAAHGLPAAELLARGDAEETDVPATRTIAPPAAESPASEPEPAPAVEPEPEVEPAAKKGAAAQG